MPYSTLSDLKKQLSEDLLIKLTDDHELGIVDQPTIDDAIAGADAEIDSYLAGRYNVPLSPVPVLVRRSSVDIAIYNLYSRRMGAPEDRVERYNNTTRLLKAISDGKATLGQTPAPAETEVGGPKAESPGRRISLGHNGSTGTMDNF